MQNESGLRVRFRDGAIRGASSGVGQVRLSRPTPGTVPAASDVPRLADQVHAALQIVNLCQILTRAPWQMRCAECKAQRQAAGREAKLRGKFRNESQPFSVTMSKTTSRELGSISGVAGSSLATSFSSTSCGGITGSEQTHRKAYAHTKRGAVIYSTARLRIEVQDFSETTKRGADVGTSAGVQWVDKHAR